MPADKATAETIRRLLKEGLDNGEEIGWDMCEDIREDERILHQLTITWLDPKEAPNDPT